MIFVFKNIYVDMEVEQIRWYCIPYSVLLELDPDLELAIIEGWIRHKTDRFLQHLELDAYSQIRRNGKQERYKKNHTC